MEAHRTGQRQVCRAISAQQEKRCYGFTECLGRVCANGVYTALGCTENAYNGYADRPSFFLLPATDQAIRAQIDARAAEADIRAAALASGLTLMRERGQRPVRDGTTSLEELIRVTREG